MKPNASGVPLLDINVVLTFCDLVLAFCNLGTVTEVFLPRVFIRIFGLRDPFLLLHVGKAIVSPELRSNKSPSCELSGTVLFELAIPWGGLC